MTVYVDDMATPVQPKHRPGRTYVMCHMIADTEAELHVMATGSASLAGGTRATTLTSPNRSERWPSLPAPFGCSREQFHERVDIEELAKEFSR